MTIDEAIGILNELPDAPIVGLDEKDFKAIELGREALKLLENPTDPRLIYARKLLLGETEK